MPRKRRSTKSRIVKAAWNLFYKNGYEQTTVEDIINAAKTSKGTFYHYFKGKEALLNSLSYLFDQKYEDLAAVIDPNLSSYDKLLFLNHELFYMIRNQRGYPFACIPLFFAIDHQRQEIPCPTRNGSISNGLQKLWKRGLPKENSKVQAPPLNSWISMLCTSGLFYMTGHLFKGKFSLTERSDKLLPHVLDTFVEGI